MQENANLIGPMLVARKNIEDDIATLLAMVNQRKKALDTLNSSIDIMRNLPERIDIDVQTREHVDRPVRKPAKIKKDKKQFLDAAFSFGNKFFTTRQLLVSINLKPGSYSRKITTDVLLASGMFERIGDRLTTKWRLKDGAGSVTVAELHAGV